MELIEVEAFVAVARSGSFTRAASQLRLSQPAVSRRIGLLEQEVGAPLFERVRDGSRLTAAGLAFMPYAEQLVAAARDGAAAIRALTAGEEGQVALALVGTLASSDLVTRMQIFRATYPAVRVTLRTARSDEVSALVREGEATLGLRYFEDPAPAVASRLVHDEALVVVCAARSRLVAADAREPTALVGAPWVGFPTGTESSGEPFARVLEHQLIKVGLGGAEIIAVDSLTAQKRLIEADFGIGLLPASSVEEELRLGSLHVVPVEGLMTTVPVHAIHRRAGYLGPAARRLLGTLMGRVAG